MLIELRQ